MRTSTFVFFTLTLLGTASPSSAQTVAATPTAGYCKLVVRGGSDSWLAVPLLKRSALMGRVTSVGPNTVTLAVSGLVDNAFVPGSNGSYYAQFVSGSLEGLNFKVLGNTAAAVFTLATGTEDLTSHVLGPVATGATGDVVRIRPYWTLGDVFGANGTGLQLDPVTDPLTETYVAGDEVRFFDNDVAGTEKTPATAFAYVAGTGWRKRGDPVVDAAMTELPPGLPFVVRHQHTDNAEVLLIGYTAPERFLFRVPAMGADEDRDVAVALANPAERALNDSNLFSPVPLFGAIEASSDAMHLRDLVLEFDSDHRGFAVLPAHRYYFSGTGWFEADVSVDARLLQPGTGYLLRLRGARTARYWLQQTPP
jgi:uncharacterized protein (TIGR02597 family)